MKIFTIFAEKLFSVQYDEEESDEYSRLLGLWSNPEYLFDYLDKKKYLLPKIYSEREIFDKIQDDVYLLLETFDPESAILSNLDFLFCPVHNNEDYGRILSLQKKKCKFIRLYAIRIDKDCFLITGGAIKLTRTMQEDPVLMEELKKLASCKNKLESSGVFDRDSFLDKGSSPDKDTFYEFISDN